MLRHICKPVMLESQHLIKDRATQLVQLPYPDCCQSGFSPLVEAPQVFQGGVRACWLGACRLQQHLVHDPKSPFLLPKHLAQPRHLQTYHIGCPVQVWNRYSVIYFCAIKLHLRPT